jgi:hypothetical protein
MTGETIEKLVIKIQADIDQAQRDLDKAKSSLKGIGNEADKAGNKMQTSGQKMTAALNAIKIYAVAAAAALGALGYKSIALAGDAVEVKNMFEAVFKDGAASAEAWAETFSNTVGRSVIETMQTMASFQDTFVPLEFDRAEAAELSKTLTELSADIASFKNTSDEEAAMAIQSALVGNHEAVRKYGIVITEASLKQEMLNMGLERTMQTATTQEKVMARLNIIMDSTTDAQGDAARTADSYANQLRALKGNISDVMAEAGQPAMEDLTQTMIDFNEWGTSGGYDQMVEGIGDVASVLATVADAGSSAIQVLTDLYTTVSSQQYDVPEGLRMTDSGMPDSFSIGVVPNIDLSTISSEYDTIQEQLNEIKQTNKDITSEVETQTQALSNQSTKIPSWAGHSDYIKERLAEIGGKNIGDMMAAADTTSNIGGTQTIGSLTQSISTSSLSVPNVSVFSQLVSVNTRGFSDVVRGLSEVKEAVNTISINVSNGSSSGTRAALTTVSTGGAVKPKLGVGQTKVVW